MKNLVIGKVNFLYIALHDCSFYESRILFSEDRIYFDSSKNWPQ